MPQEETKVTIENDCITLVGPLRHVRMTSKGVYYAVDEEMLRPADWQPMMATPMGAAPYRSVEFDETLPEKITYTQSHNFIPWVSVLRVRTACTTSLVDLEVELKYRPDKPATKTLWNYLAKTLQEPRYVIQLTLKELSGSSNIYVNLAVPLETSDMFNVMNQITKWLTT